MKSPAKATLRIPNTHGALHSLTEWGIRADHVAGVRRILTALMSAADMAGVQGPPGWRIHQLTGDRAGTWSISVSGNWRITFRLEDEDVVTELDYEDYR